MAELFQTHRFQERVGEIDRRVGNVAQLLDARGLIHGGHLLQQAVNVGIGERITVNALIASIAKVIGSDIPIDYRPSGGPTPNLPDPALIEPGVGDNFIQGMYPAADWNYWEAPPKLWTNSLNGTGSSTSQQPGPLPGSLPMQASFGSVQPSLTPHITDELTANKVAINLSLKRQRKSKIVMRCDQQPKSPLFGSPSQSLPLKPAQLLETVDDD